MTHNAESGEGRTLYAVILAGLIEWAGPSADLEDCRSAARHLTPSVRAHVTRVTTPADHARHHPEHPVPDWVCLVCGATGRDPVPSVTPPEVSE